MAAVTRLGPLSFSNTLHMYLCGLRVFLNHVINNLKFYCHNCSQNVEVQESNRISTKRL